MVHWAHPSLHPKRHVDRYSRFCFCTAHRGVSHYNYTLEWAARFSPKIAPFLGDRIPIEHMVPWSHPSHQPKRHLDLFSFFVWVPNAMLYNALSMGKKTPKIAPFPFGFRHPVEGGPSHGRSQPTKNGKDSACDSGDMLIIIIIMRHHHATFIVHLLQTNVRT